ncbi:hypothetical protein GCM10007147_20120 [Nocardiopsis kunsanensis]|uniref:Trehalase-like N-terminal domain-containing protein n=1 Tax=Nocardiopsis kunsanensis TaxID=141693 RepID=A0A918XCC7_9ACTN|nr:hypothetical protein GCM10007147_20120 [Nocardiopsis kunsanensis]
MEWTGEPGIGEHAFLSDCGTAALLDPYGTIDWLCVPDFDSPPLLWSLLDRDRGGSWSMHVEDAVPTRLTYAADTLVAETLWEGPGCRLLSQDLLAVRPDGEGLRPIGVLVRFLTCLEGRARIRSTFRAGPDLGRARAEWTAVEDGALRLREGVLLSGGTAPVLDGEGDPAYRVGLAAGESTSLVLDHSRGDRQYGVEEARTLLEDSRRAWRDWASRTSYEGEGPSTCGIPPWCCAGSCTRRAEGWSPRPRPRFRNGPADPGTGTTATSGTAMRPWSCCPSSGSDTPTRPVPTCGTC